MEDGTKFIFMKYVAEYGIFRNDGSIGDGDLIGFKEDAPAEVKKSWAEYQKLQAKWREEGIK